MSAMFTAPGASPNAVDSEAAATGRASALLRHRNELAHARAMVARLMAELEAMMQKPELFERVREVLELSGVAPTTDQRLDMRGALSMIASLPMRAKIVKIWSMRCTS